MGRKSRIDQLPASVREHILKRLRENRLTLDGLMTDLRQQFPDQAEELPSRSGVGRYSQAVSEIVKREHEIAAAAGALVAELGEDFDSKSGALLAQAVTTLASRTALHHVQADQPMEIGDVLDLARAAKATQEARSLNLRERQAVRKMAREEALAEAAQKADETAKKLGVSPDGIKALRDAIIRAL